MCCNDGYTPIQRRTLLPEALGRADGADLDVDGLPQGKVCGVINTPQHRKAENFCVWGGVCGGEGWIAVWWGNKCVTHNILSRNVLKRRRRNEIQSPVLISKTKNEAGMAVSL